MIKTLREKYRNWKVPGLRALWTPHGPPARPSAGPRAPPAHTWGNEGLRGSLPAF